MSKVNEIYENGLEQIGHKLDDYFYTGVVDAETTFLEINEIISDINLDVANQYINQSGKYEIEDKVDNIFDSARLIGITKKEIETAIKVMNDINNEAK